MFHCFGSAGLVHQRILQCLMGCGMPWKQATEMDVKLQRKGCKGCS